MQIKLLDYTKLSNAVIAARTCWDSFHKGGNYELPTDNIDLEDKKLLDRLMHQYKHESIFEHVFYNFNIKGLPRFVLIELTRHRICSYSVKSTRYTLKELKNEDSFIKYELGFNGENILTYDFDRIKKYIDLNEDNEQIIYSQVLQLEQLRNYVHEGNSLDKCKYLVPENYKCDLVWSINVRSLQNFLTLRLSKAAHFKIRELAEKVYQAIPESHKFLFTIPENKENG